MAEIPSSRKLPSVVEDLCKQRFLTERNFDQLKEMAGCADMDDEEFTRSEPFQKGMERIKEIDAADGHLLRENAFIVFTIESRKPQQNVADVTDKTRSKARDVAMAGSGS